MIEKKPRPVFHGHDKRAAIARAKKIGGTCVYSLAPGSSLSVPVPEFGYWSDIAGVLLRSWEEQIELDPDK